MKKSLAFVVVLFLVSFFQNSWAQQPTNEIKKEAYEEAAKRTTLVVLMTEDPKKTIKLKKTPEDYQAYQNDIAAYNERLKFAVEKWWKFTEKYEFHSYAEVLKMSKGKLAKSYLVLMYQVQRMVQAPPTAVINAVMPYKKLSTPEEWGCFELRSAENLMPTKPAFATARLPYLAPNGGHVIFALQIVQFDMQNKMEGLNLGQIKRNVATNGKNLQSKTLYIDKTELDDNELDESTIKKLYAYDYVVEDKDTIQARIVSAAPEAAYIMIVPTDHNNMVHYIVSAEDGTVCLLWETPYDPKAKRKDRIPIGAMKYYGKMAK
jgi:hypothetical protein